MCYNKDTEREVINMTMIDCIGWAVVGAVALTDIIGVVHCIKWFVKIRKANREDD